MSLSATPSAPPAIISDTRFAAYAGPWPRKRHAHRCTRCGQGRSVACYKTGCTRSRVTQSCQYCRR
jgi:hypothetical protein